MVLSAAVDIVAGRSLCYEDQRFQSDRPFEFAANAQAFGRRTRGSQSQLPTERPLLQRGEQRVQLGQGGAVGGFEGFDGLDAGGEGLLEGEGGNWYFHSLNFSAVRWAIVAAVT